MNLTACLWVKRLAVASIFFILTGLAGCSAGIETVSTPIVTPIEPALPTQTIIPTPTFTPLILPSPTNRLQPAVTLNPVEGLNDEIIQIIKERGGEWHIFITDQTGRVIYARGDYDELHPASVIKVVIAFLFFKALEQEKPVADLESHLETHGVDGRTYDQLLQAMLVRSEEAATQSLQNWIQDRLSVAEQLHEWGLSNTRLEPRRSSLLDLEKVFRSLIDGDWVSLTARQYILTLMQEYTPNDDLRLGGIRSCLAEGEELYNKRGTLTDELLIVGDAALIERDGQTYFVGVFAYQAKQPSHQTTYEALEEGMTDLAVVFCNHIGLNH